MPRQKTIAIVPALNEEKTISEVITDLKKHVDEIILVDDASTDKTANIAQREGAILISHKKTKGYDKSIDNGFKLALKRGATITLTFDADGQHNAEDIPKIVNPILEGKADVVVGKRPRHQRLTEYLFSFISKGKIGVDDPLCGLKAYHMKVYKDVGYFDRISSIGTQLMFTAKKRGYRLVQRTVTLNKRVDRPRFGRRIKAEWKILKAIFKILYWNIMS